jgi:serine/threonine-protein kinase HipA
MNREAGRATLVRRYARASVSGVVPKFLAPQESTSAPRESMLLGKPTLRTAHHIVKGSDENTPYLGFNEFYSMRVLERLQVVPVAGSRMSDDGRVLIVERFEVDAGGVPTHGLEDACGLLGLPPHEKYATTTEKLLHATRAYLPSGHVREQMEQFGWHLLTNYVVRNADCHAKNVALYFSSLKDVRYTPVYDIVTTQAYPRFASSPPALSVSGRKTWAPGKTLEQFFNARLGIAPRQYAEMVERLCESAVVVGNEVIEAAKNEPRWRSVAKNMVHAWNDGMSSLRSPKLSAQFRGLNVPIADAGFSDPEPPVLSKEKLGASELLTRPRRKS